MTSRAAIANEAARRIWERTTPDLGAPEKAVAAAERLCTQLSATLTRWIGAEGYRALLTRAVGSVRATHPALSRVPCLGHVWGPGDDATAAAPAAAVAAGMVALVAALIELLGRIIGDEMAARLMEQGSAQSPRGGVGTETERGQDG